MAYKKRPEITTDVPGESVVELADGALVAVAIKHLRSEITQAPVFEVTARWVDGTGETLKDAHGKPVAITHRHHSTQAEVEKHSLARLQKACLFLVLGEEIETHLLDDETRYPIVAFSEEVRAQQSIRNAIASAKRTFETVKAHEIL